MKDFHAITIGQSGTVIGTPSVAAPVVGAALVASGSTSQLGWTTAAVATLQDLANAIAGVSLTWDAISGKPATFPPSAHSHAIADVNNLQAALDARQPLDADLSAIAGLSTTAYGRGLLETGATSAIVLPSGTTAQRPGSPSAGMARWNSETSRHEFWTGSQWVNHARLSGDDFSGPISVGRVNFTSSGIDTFIAHTGTFQLSLGVNNSARLRIGTGGVELLDTGAGFGWADAGFFRSSAGVLDTRSNNGVRIQNAAGNAAVPITAGEYRLNSNNFAGAGASITQPANNTLAFNVSNGTSVVERARISPAGRVLVGTTTDDGFNQLQLTGGASIAGRVNSPTGFWKDGPGEALTVTNSSALVFDQWSTGRLRGMGGNGLQFEVFNAVAFRSLVSGDANIIAGSGLFSGIVRLGPYTFATLPSASANVGANLRITDRGQRQAYSDGTNWRWWADDAIVS